MRAQAHTLEAFVASLLVLGGVLFAIQATAVTPLSASTSNQHIEAQQRAQAADLMVVADANDTLRPAVVAAGNGTYSKGGPPNQFGRLLNETFGSERVAFNVALTHEKRGVGNGTGSLSLVYMGSPTDNAVSTHHAVVLYDDTPFPGPYANVSAARDAGEFYAEDISPDSELYNVVEVTIVVWRI